MSDLNPVVRSKPVADQALDILRERIQSGFYRPDERMPSEAQLAEELRISRSSLRTALASLAAEGFIRRRHGDGTYTCPRSFQLTLRSGRGWDIERQIVKRGQQASIRVLEMGRRMAEGGERKLLDLAEGDELYAIRRLVSADGAPVGLIESLILLDGLSTELSLADGELPPQELLSRSHSRQPHDGEIRFYAKPAERKVAQLLGIEAGAPLLAVEGRYFDATRRPLLLMREAYRGEQGFEFQAGFLQS